MTDLTFHTIDGIRLASAPLNGEARAFGAKITRSDHVLFDGKPGYLLQTYTYGRHLDSGHFRTLADARTFANVTYRTVEV